MDRSAHGILREGAMPLRRKGRYIFGLFLSFVMAIQLSSAAALRHTNYALPTTQIGDDQAWFPSSWRR